MHELYAYPNTYAMGVHMLLHESGVRYRVIDVSDKASAATQGFKEASPHLRVPAMRFADGRTQCESGAIALYLADTLCDGNLSIAPTSPDRAEFLQWLFYFSSTLQPEVMIQFHPEYYFDDTTTQHALKTASMQRLDTIWPIIEARYADGPWMFENRPTAVDFSLAPVLLWPECFPAGSGVYPNLQRTLDSLQERKSCAEVLSWHRRETDVTGRAKPVTES